MWDVSDVMWLKWYVSDWFKVADCDILCYITAKGYSQITCLTLLILQENKNKKYANKIGMMHESKGQLIGKVCTYICMA